MKSNTSKLSVGFVGFLEHRTPDTIEGVHSESHANIGFPKNPQTPDSEPDNLPGEPAAEGHASWTRTMVPDSRQPLTPPEVRAKIEAIEAEARALGWPPELLWNAGFWDCPRGLAAVLDLEDELVNVMTDQIVIRKMGGNMLRFRRHAS
jgi:hypothetical protein